MSELVEFIRGCLDADEQTARAATEGPWEAWRRHTADGFAGDTFGVCAESAGDVDDDIVQDPGLLQADATHIARHDPARVLAEVNAKRAILDSLVRQCAAPVPVNDALASRHYGLLDGLHVAVRLLAQPYAGEPGWRDEWGTQ